MGTFTSKICRKAKVGEEFTNNCYNLIYLRINYFYSLMLTAFTPHFLYNHGPLHCIVSSLKTRKQRGHLQYCKIFFATRIFNQCRNKAFIIDGCWGCNWGDFILMPCLAAPWLKFPTTRKSLWTFHPCGSCNLGFLKSQRIRIYKQWIWYSPAFRKKQMFMLKIDVQMLNLVLHSLHWFYWIWCCPWCPAFRKKQMVMLQNLCAKVKPSSAMKLSINEDFIRLDKHLQILV